MSSYIEFGDFSVANIVSICDGVTLPASWSFEESFNSSLSFFIAGNGESGNLSFNELLLTLPSLQSPPQNNVGSLSELANGSSSYEEPIKTSAANKNQHIGDSNYSSYYSDASNVNKSLAVESPYSPKVDDPLVLSKVQTVQPELNLMTEISSSTSAPLPGAKMRLEKESAFSLTPATYGLATYDAHVTSKNEVSSLSTSTAEESKHILSDQKNSTEQPRESMETIGMSKTVMKMNTEQNNIPKESAVSNYSKTVVPELPSASSLAGDSMPDTLSSMSNEENQHGENSQTNPVENTNHSILQNDANEPTGKSLNKASKVALKKENSVTKAVIVEPENDPQALDFANELSLIALVCKPKPVVPRGLYNMKNCCYINATLQALLACPPFFHLLKRLSFVCHRDRNKTSTPIMDSFVKLASQFRSLSFQYCHQHGREIQPERPFTPICVYEMLGLIKSSLSNVGGQEDAEEFLSCILNGFHEEILKLFALLPNGLAIDENGLPTCSDEENNSSNGDDNSSFVNSKQGTPISNIFRGELCTTVTRPNRKPSVSNETFFTLPIDVSTECTWSVEDALSSLTDGEHCHDSDSDEESSALLLRQQTIKTLPPILILHLKRFFYDDRKGGLTKVDKKVRFNTDLIIEQKWLSESAQIYTLDQRSYKLFAVVYHHGVKASGGHYTADVFHIGMRSWLRFDDQNVFQIKLQDVLIHSSKRTPYLLYYRQLRS